MLDSSYKTNTVYIEDNDGQKYYWYGHEVLEEDISIRKLQKKKVELKFNKEYKPKKEIKKMVFSNVIVNGLNTLEFEIFL